MRTAGEAPGLLGLGDGALPAARATLLLDHLIRLLVDKDELEPDCPLCAELQRRADAIRGQR
jgi:hypothetical protein